jgi:hypothetical protein
LGIAGFSHDFRAIQGQHSIVAQVLDSLSTIKLSSVEIFKLVLGFAFPILTHIPTQRKSLLRKFKRNAEEISKVLFERTRKEKEGDVEKKQDRSVIGVLSMFDFIHLPAPDGHGADRPFTLVVKSSSDSSMSEEEVVAQVSHFAPLRTHPQGPL